MFMEIANLHELQASSVTRVSHATFTTPKLHARFATLNEL
jgi:hypothetical protein